MQGRTASIGHLLLTVLTAVTSCSSTRAASLRTSTSATSDSLSVAWLLDSCWWLGDNDKGIYCCADAPTGASFFMKLEKISNKSRLKTFYPVLYLVGRKISPTHYSSIKIKYFQVYSIPLACKMPDFSPLLFFALKRPIAPNVAQKSPCHICKMCFNQGRLITERNVYIWYKIAISA